ncbi:APC family permease [Pseudonocardia spinosispora]|uniref:APC family permease n=1 Tax=Pseudonocardia spinosispora TaxID=103441 RepID=UPI0003F508B0|nr:APC family permease [Pseudonocardia spinosispora]
MQQQARLSRSLGVLDGVVIAASSIAATTSIGIGMGVLAASVGRQTPAILLIAFFPIVGIAVAYSRLNRVEPDCGNGYVWVGRTMGPWLGLIAGWIPIAGTVVFMSYTTAVVGSVLVQLVEKAGVHSVLGWALDANSTAQCTAVGLVVFAVVTWIAVTGTAHAAHFQKYLLIFEYVVLLGFCGWGLATGHQSFSFSWLDPFAVDSFAGFAQGLAIAVFFYWGWDSAFSVTEETHDSRDAARSGFIALVTMLGLFLLGSIAFQRVMDNGEMVDKGAEGLTYFAAKLAGEPLATLPLVALMLSAVSSLQAGIIPTARFTLAMGRNRTLGTVWTRVHPRYRTPAAGTVIITAITAVIAVLMPAIPKLNEAILAAVNAIGILVALYYGLASVTCAVRFRGLLRTGRRAAVGAVGVPAVCGTVLLALGGYLAVHYATVSDTFEIDAANGWFTLAVPLVILLIGLAVGAVAKWYRRAPDFHGHPTPDPVPTPERSL